MGDAPPEEELLPLIPWPRHLERRLGRFLLKRPISAPTTAAPALSEPAWEILRPLLARCGTVVRRGEDMAQIRFEHLGGRGAGEHEAYELDVGEDRIVLRADARAGFLHAAQTLRQLLPAASETPAANAAERASIPCLLVRDRPRLRWRGMHVDVARHFFPRKDLERFVDTMALHKLNTLHLHLTDDQGWRVAIDGWPRLTEIGGTRAESPRKRAREKGDGAPYGGWYSQDGLRKLVAYADARGIQVVPEIDLPGHMQAAIAAYPELGHGAPPEVWTRWGISERILNVKPRTIEFLRDVLQQIADLFPAPYIHLGGDEVPTGEWERSTSAQTLLAGLGHTDVRQLQGWFVGQVLPVLRGAGKRAILWDEALEFGASAETVVMVWRATSHAREAARRGHEVIVCPQSHCYFDHYQGPPAREPEAIGGDTPLAKVLAFDPGEADWDDAERTHLLGIQGNLWSEYIHDAAHLEYMAWPRGCALAEVAWRPLGGREQAEFQTRFEGHARRLKAMDVFYRKLDT